MENNFAYDGGERCTLLHVHRTEAKTCTCVRGSLLTWAASFAQAAASLQSTLLKKNLLST